MTASEACDGGVCFRIVDGRRVEELVSGAWRRSFEFTDEQQRRLRARVRNPCGYRRAVDLRALTVVRRPDGPHVVVAAAQQGVLHRSPDGTWERRAMLDRKPVLLAGPSWLSRLPLVPLGLLVLCPALFLIGRSRSGARFGWVVAGGTAGAAIALLVVAGALMFFGADYVVSGPLIAYLSRSPCSRRQPPWPARAALVIGRAEPPRASSTAPPAGSPDLEARAPEGDQEVIAALFAGLFAGTRRLTDGTPPGATWYRCGRRS